MIHCFKIQTLKKVLDNNLSFFFQSIFRLIKRFTLTKKIKLEVLYF